MKIECCRQLGAGQTDTRTHRQSDTLSSCRSQKQLLKPCPHLHLLLLMFKLRAMNDVILDILCPGSILPVLPDGVEDDGKSDVEDEEGKSTTQCNKARGL